MVGKFLLGMVSGGLLVTGSLVVASMLAPTRPANDNAPTVAMEEPIAAPKATAPEAGATVAEPKDMAAELKTEAPAATASEPEEVAPALPDEPPAAPIADNVDPAPAPEAPVAEVAAPETKVEPSKPSTAEADVAATPDPVAPAAKAATAETEVADAGAATTASPDIPAPAPEPAPAETSASGETAAAASAEPAVKPETEQTEEVAVAEAAPAPEATAVTEPTTPEPAVSEPADSEPAVTEPAAEAPAAQAPALDAPAVDARNAEPAPAADPAPVAEAPAPATPDVEAPASDATASEPQPEPAPADPSAPEVATGEGSAADPSADTPVAETPADAMPAPADAAPEADAPEMPGSKPAPLPGVTEPAETPAIVVAEDEGSTTFKPTPGLIKSGEGVIIGRDKPAEEAPVDPSVAPVDPRPIAQFATAFENPEAKPPFAIVLVDPGTADLDRAGLAALPFPVSFALDPLDPATAERAAAYRAGGKEVVMLVTGIADGAQASDVEVAFQSMEQGLPEAVAAMELATPSFQNNRGLATAVVPILKAQGRGLLTWDEGLNAADQVARREDLEAAVVFRNLDQAGGDKVAVRRLLDRAVFKADQDGRVSVVGTANADTVAALLEWTVEGKAATVALAPLTAVLKVD